MSPVVSQHVELLVMMSRVEGKVDGFAATSARHEDAITKVVSELGQHKVQTSADLGLVRDRLTAIEATRRASPPWWVVVGAVVPAIALILVLAEQIYGK